MNRILVQLTAIIEKAIREYLPNVKARHLEEGGTIYYMNGQNGTMFDWFVNDRLSNFMVFYRDRANLGAVKASLYRDGGLVLYLYGDRGKTLVRTVKDTVLAFSEDFTENDLLRLAVTLWQNADEKRVWDSAITRLATEEEPSQDQIEAFLSCEEYHADTRRHMDQMSLLAIVSKKITEENWNVGYMIREESDREGSSGWWIYAGDEDDDYLSNPSNFTLLPLGRVWQLDPAVWDCLLLPVGSRVIRISKEQFAPDREDKSIYMHRREG